MTGVHSYEHFMSVIVEELHRLHGKPAEIVGVYDLMFADQAVQQGRLAWAGSPYPGVLLPADTEGDA